MRLRQTMNKPFFYNYDFRSAFLAGVANRLRDQISNEAQGIFKRNKLITPVTDVSLMLFLNFNGPSSITDIARALDFSHQRVALRIGALENLKLLSRKVDKNDQRRKLITMTTLAKKEMLFIEKMYIQTSKKIDAMFEHLEINLMDKIQEAIEYLEKEPLTEPH